MEAEFLLSAASCAQFPDTPYPETAFAGRSNVGKSSMINRLLERKSLVKTGRTPGKTRLINFFLAQKRIMFTDLPGYGYAAVSKAERASWGRLMESYFRTRRQLRLCVLLLDIRRDPNGDDMKMLEAMRLSNIEALAVLTKADKLSGNGRVQRIKAASEALGMDKSRFILFSSLTGEGREKVWEAIENSCRL